MADDWENDDWETTIDAKVAQVKPVAADNGDKTRGEALLAQLNAPDRSKFANEDKDFEKASAPNYSVPAPQPKKKEEKKYRDESLPVDEPLDDPIAEKLRQQRLVEQSDYEAAQDLFGHAMKPLSTYLPKTVKEFEEFAAEIVGRHVTAHKESKNYKAFVKALVKGMLEPLPSEEVKDIETCVAGVKADRIKVEKAKASEKKGKKTLNMGKGGLSAGLDEFQYDEDYAGGDGDGDDFM